MTQLLTPQPARHPNPIVKATALAHLIFERPDLALAERFLCDFGLKPCSKTDSALLPEKKKWEIFFKVQSKRPQYLKPGQMVEASIRSADGRVDLGMQRNRIAEEG
ncbi:MAG: hypothetical protein HPY82_18440 [Gammaproteobacteria bacterium]|nr:hypothetical protein [Gammaproteobacteria bacterium]